MIRASLYILFCSARNRLRVRLQRLREPRYLVGAIVGLAYFWFVFFARLRPQTSTAGRRRRGASLPQSAEQLASFTAAGPTIAGLALMVAMGAAWIVPFESVLLQFSPAEVQFLFPAPVSRRSLLLHRLLRSQMGMVFGAVIFGIALPSLGGGLARVRTGMAIWLLMCTLRVYFTGVSLARISLRSSDRRARRVAWIALGAMASAWTIVGAALVRTFATDPLPRAAGFGALWSRIWVAATTGASTVALAPFVAATRPFFVAWSEGYGAALLGSIAVLAVCLVWVVLSDGALQSVTDTVTSDLSPAATAALGVAARASSNGGGAGTRPAAATSRAWSQAWPLAPVGSTEAVFAWKAATQTFRSFDRRLVLRLLVIAAVTTGTTASGLRHTPLVGVVGGMALVGSAFAVLLAPQAVRLDLRQDLQHLDLLKTWPVRAPSLVRGELLWPAVLITAVAWSLLTIVAVLSPALFPEVSPATRFAVIAAAMALAPAVVLAQLVIQNAAALLFPAWVQLGTQRSRGVDAMGQRIITLGGSWLVLIAMILPGALAGGAIWLVFRGWLGPAALVPAALVCAATLAAEALVATEALGPLYERLDVLAVERAAT